MVPARRLRGLGRTATIKSGGLLMDSENPQTASPLKQLQINVIPDQDWIDRQGVPADSGVVPPFRLYPPDTAIGVDAPNGLLPATPIDKFTTPPQFPQYLLESNPAGDRTTHAAARAGTDNGSDSTVSTSGATTTPAVVTDYGKVIYPVSPPIRNQKPAPVTILPNTPVTTTVTQAQPGTTTGNGNPAPAVVTQTPTGLIPQSVTPPAGTVSLFGYNIPTSYLLIGGALLVLWMMDTHKSGGKR